MDISVIENILSRTSSGKDYKNYCLVCRAWYVIINKLFPGGDKFCNHLITLLAKLPDYSLVDGSTDERSTNKHWDYTHLSRNRNITLEYIADNPDKPWTGFGLSSNPNITQEYIESHPEIDWNYDGMIFNKSISCNFLIKNIDKILTKNNIVYVRDITWDIVENNPAIWDYTALSFAPCVTLDIVKNNPNKPWNYNYIVMHNPNITWENIHELPKNMVSIFCKNPNVFNGIENYEHYENLIDYNALSGNYKITEEYVLKNLDKPWNYCILSIYINKISWKLLGATLDKPWDYPNLSLKMNLTVDEFKKVIDKPWNCIRLSGVITWDYVLEFPNGLPNGENWDYLVMSTNYNIPLETIFKNPEKNWSYYYLSSRRDLTWQDVVNHPEISWRFQALSHNTFGKV